MTRPTRWLCAALLAGLLAGCSSEGSSDYAQIFEYAGQAWSGDGKTITLAQAASTPYASISVQIGDGPQRMLLLATDSGDEQIWTSSSHLVITTQDGRIVRTVGLAHDLSALAPAQSGALTSPSASARSSTVEAMRADYSKDMLFSEHITCRARPGGSQKIKILGQMINTRRVDEHCESPSLNWQFDNTYWIDPASNLVWRSIQHIHPNVDAITIETLRPPQQ